MNSGMSNGIFFYEGQENDKWWQISLNRPLSEDFEYTEYLENIKGTIIIPSTFLEKEVREIRYEGFANASNIIKVEIPNTIETIDYNAFSKCCSLESIVIPSSVKKIGEGAFFCCEKLTIFCEAEKTLKGWDDMWNQDSRPVYFANQWHYDENGEPLVNE